MIYAVVLATREGDGGSPSAALTSDGEGRRYVERIRRTAHAAGIERMIVVVGPPDGEAVRKVLAPGVAWAANPRPERGPMSSVQVGLTALPHAARAALIWPAEAALVDVATVQALVAASAGAAANKLVVPTWEGHDGLPVRLPRALFGEVSMLPVDATLWAYVAGRSDAVRVDVEDRAVLAGRAVPKKVEARTGPTPAAPKSASPARPRSPRPRPAKAR